MLQIPAKWVDSQRRVSKGVIVVVLWGWGRADEREVKKMMVEVVRVEKCIFQLFVGRVKMLLLVNREWLRGCWMVDW